MGPALKARFNAPVHGQPTQIGAGMNRAFSAGGLALPEFLGRCPRLVMNAAPLALNRYVCSAKRLLWRDVLPHVQDSPRRVSRASSLYPRAQRQCAMNW